MLIEASDPKVVASFISKFTDWNDVNIVLWSRRVGAGRAVVACVGAECIEKLIALRRKVSVGTAVALFLSRE